MSKCCLILGSGFGLYGYLPAACECGYNILLPERYKSILESRRDLNQYIDNVCLVNNDEVQKILNSVNLMIIAKRPEDQEMILDKMLKNTAFPNRIILEKPLAINPNRAVNLWNRINSVNNISFRIGYSFVYTQWGRQVVSRLMDNGDYDVYIRWSFVAHHFKNEINTWKRHENEGGGALRFYGVQFVGLLSSFGKWDLVCSETLYKEADECYFWHCSLLHGRSRVNIQIDSDFAKELFSCKIYDKSILNHAVPPLYEYESISPFETTKKVNRDARVDILKMIINSFDKDDDGSIVDEKCIGNSIKLWEMIDNNTIRKMV